MSAAAAAVASSGADGGWRGGGRSSGYQYASCWTCARATGGGRQYQYASCVASREQKAATAQSSSPISSPPISSPPNSYRMEDPRAPIERGEKVREELMRDRGLGGLRERLEVLLRDIAHAARPAEQGVAVGRVG